MGSKILRPNRALTLPSFFNFTYQQYHGAWAETYGNWGDGSTQN